MKERPILFSGPMVRAILDGRKTQTRRVIKPQPFFNQAGYLAWKTSGCLQNMGRSAETMLATHCPYGQQGDRLWVREAIESLGGWTERDKKGLIDAEFTYSRIRYLSDGQDSKVFGKTPILYRRQHLQKIPSIHMPRWASRITVEITGIRVERLQEISDEDCLYEGVEATDFWEDAERQQPATGFSAEKYAYRSLWESINGPGSWDANPWVWVVEFRRVV